MNKILLTSIKINTVKSGPTRCFSATVLFNGETIGQVCNRGRGDANEYRMSLDALNSLRKWSEDSSEATSNLDVLIDLLVEGSKGGFVRESELVQFAA